MGRLYILDAAGEPVKCHDLMRWGEWFASSAEERQVAYDQVGDVTVSTVFLGIDRNHNLNLNRRPRDDRPVLYETMVFSPTGGESQRRYATRLEAMKGHVDMLLEAVTAARAGEVTGGA